jgi:hypothetical protein
MVAGPELAASVLSYRQVLTVIRFRSSQFYSQPPSTFMDSLKLHSLNRYIQELAECVFAVLWGDTAEEDLVP